MTPVRPARRGPRRRTTAGRSAPGSPTRCRASTPRAAGRGPAALARYCLVLGDDALIYSHRLQQWMTRMPELEEETAIANIALDLLGQARMLLARAAGYSGRARTSSRSSAPSPSSATSGWSSTATATSPSWWPAADLHHLAAGAVRAGSVTRQRPGAGGDRRQGGQGAGLPPRLRRAVGGPARRRHRPVARKDAGRAGRALAAGRRAVPALRRRARAVVERGDVDVVLDTVFATATA